MALINGEISVPVNLPNTGWCEIPLVEYVDLLISMGLSDDEINNKLSEVNNQVLNQLADILGDLPILDNNQTESELLVNVGTVTNGVFTLGSITIPMGGVDNES